MQCREISDLMMKYFDGSFSEIELEQITRHNKGCKQCDEEFEALKSAIFALEDLPEPEIPAGFEARVMESIRTQKAYFVNPQVLLYWLVGIVGLLVFAANMVSNFVIPFARESGMLLVVYNTAIFVLNYVFGMLREALTVMSVLLGKLLVFRNILFKDYMAIANMIIVLFMFVDFLLVRALKLQRQ